MIFQHTGLGWQKAVLTSLQITEATSAVMTSSLFDFRVTPLKNYIIQSVLDKFECEKRAGIQKRPQNMMYIL